MPNVYEPEIMLLGFTIDFIYFSGRIGTSSVRLKLCLMLSGVQNQNKKMLSRPTRRMKKHWA